MRSPHLPPIPRPKLRKTLIGLLALTGSLSILLGYVPGRSGSGRLLRRSLDSLPFQFRLNDQTRAGFSSISTDSDPVTAVEASFRTWESVATAGIRFAPLIMSSEDSVGRPAAPNLVTFADTAANRELVGSALAVTRINFTFTSSVATITRTDIAFNPTIEFSTTLEADTFDIQSVLTHEIGHALGADHSGIIGATMFQASGRQQSHQRVLSTDDIAFASFLYPRSGAAAPFGSISGQVTLSGEPLFGAHMVAYEEKGTHIVGTLTNPDGSYTITGLQPGRYLLYAEPLDDPVGLSNLGSFYRSANASFPSTFLGSAGNPRRLDIIRGQELTDINLKINDGPAPLNIELAGRTAGETFTSVIARSGALTAHPGERFIVVLGGNNLDRIRSLDQVRILGGGVRKALGATLLRFSFNSGLPGLGFLVEVGADAPAGLRTFLAADGTNLAMFSGGMVVVDSANPGSTTTTTVALSTTTTSTTSTSTTLPPTTSSTSTTIPVTSTTSITSTTSTTIPVTSTTTTTSTTTSTTAPPPSSTSTTLGPSTTTTTSTTSTSQPTTTSSTSTTTTVPGSTSTTSTTSTTTTTVTTTSTSTSTSSTTTTTFIPEQSHRLHFPFLFSDSTFFTGIALANTSREGAQVTLTAYNSAGVLLSGLGVRNPFTIFLAAGAQAATIADQIFQFTAGMPQKGWLEVRSDNRAVTGFYLLGDYAQEFIDGADVTPNLDSELVLAGVNQSTSIGTEISFVNPDPRRFAQVVLDLYNQEGGLLSSIDRTINPLGRIYGSIPSVFGISRLELGSIEVHSDIGLAGAMITGEALRVDGGPMTRLAVLAAHPQSSASRRTYIPHYIAGGGFTSNVLVTNSGDAPADIQLRLLGDNAAILAAPVQRLLQGHRTLSLSPEAFQFSSASGIPVEGYLQLDASEKQVFGSVTFQDVEGKRFVAGLNSLDRGVTEAFISQVAIGVFGYFTGVACLDVSSGPAVVDVMIYDAVGSQVARGTRILPAGGRFADLLEEITGFGGPQQGGYVRILSTQPVVCFGLLGTERTLASVPAQRIEK